MRPVARIIIKKMFYSDLAGKTDLERAKTDMIVDCMADIIKQIYVFIKETDETKQVID